MFYYFKNMVSIFYYCKFMNSPQICSLFQTVTVSKEKDHNLGVFELSDFCTYPAHNRCILNAFSKRKLQY